MRRIKIIDITLLSLFLAALFFLWLGDRPLFVPDEGRYAEIAREMLVSHDYVIPHLNNIVYFEKPPLFYWLGALSFKYVGTSVFAIRLINASLGLFGCFITYLFCRTLYNRDTGLIAALILGTNLLYFTMSHMASLDLPVTVFMMATLYAGFLRKYGLAALTAAGAVLAKGLIGLLLPGLILGAWHLIASSSRFTYREVCSVVLPALMLFLVLVLPWHLLAFKAYPAFFSFYFIEQHFLRYTNDAIGHRAPVWFFIPWLLAGFLPWTLLLPQTLRWHMKHREERERSLFFVVWVAIIFCFFSFSKSKLIPYILPLFPALSILCARYLQTRSWKMTGGFLLFATSILLTLTIVAPTLDTRTILPLATILKPRLTTHDEVIAYHRYYQDLPFYLERQVSVVNWQNELAFGMKLQHESPWMLNEEQFWQRYRSKHLYILIGKDEFESFKITASTKHLPYHILANTKNTLLLSN